MNVVFWTIALVMTLAALAFVLPALLLHRREHAGADAARKLEALESAHAAGVLSDAEYRAKREALQEPGPAAAVPRPSRASALLLALLLPLAAWLLYLQLGEPRVLDGGAVPTVAGDTTDAQPPTGAQAQSLEQATAGLAERMRNSPDDLGGWMLLGRAYKTMQRFDAAREALANAYRLAPEDADVLVEYAEALTLSTDTRRIEGEAAELLDRALALQPLHERGLWMKGIQAYQDRDFAAAAATWQRLRDGLPPNADVRASLDERIADARGRAGLPALEPAQAATGADPATAGADAGPAAPPTAAQGAADASAEGPRLTVQVDIAPALKARIGASDVLFVFARAPAGSRMPVAIRRLAAADLPVTVVLDDSTSMMPQLKLSTLPEVVVGARVSKSGQAVPQPGDFETFSDPVSTATGTVHLVIDEVVE